MGSDSWLGFEISQLNSLLSWASSQQDKKTKIIGKIVEGTVSKHNLSVKS